MRIIPTNNVKPDVRFLMYVDIFSSEFTYKWITTFFGRHSFVTLLASRWSGTSAVPENEFRIVTTWELLKLLIFYVSDDG